MSLVVVTAAPGNPGVTTTALALTATAGERDDAIMAECDPSGGDVAGWIGGAADPSWVSAVASADRSWAGFCRHLRSLPSGQQVMLAPSWSAHAEATIDEAADRFGPLLASLTDALVVADTGRCVAPTAWHRRADEVVVVVRQEPASAHATVPRIDRSVELVRRLQAVARQVGVLVIGSRPYDPAEIAETADAPLVGAVPHDPGAAALLSGAWSLGRGAGRSRLVKAFRPVAAELVDRVTTTSGRSMDVTPDRDDGERTIGATTDEEHRPVGGSRRTTGVQQGEVAQ